MKLMILDGNSVINRAFYGVRPLTTRDGLYTNAIFGFLNILQKVTAEEAPDALCVAFDLHGPTFRHLKYDGYKATRHPMPEELAMQMPIMKQVLEAMNIPIYECQGWEADDVIGTVAKACSSSGWDCVILTGDRDSLQLVDPHVTVKLVRSQAGQTTTVNYTPAVFEAEYGFAPARLIDLKALMGDSSDNIPGVAGVGPKTAGDLLHKFGTLDGVYAHLDSPEIKAKLREKLENGREMAYLSYDLATIRCNAPLMDFAPEKNLVQPPKRRALYDLFTRLEFQKLIDRYQLRSAAFEETDDTEKTEAFTAECTVEEVETLARATELLDGRTVYLALSDGMDAAAFCHENSNTMYLLKRETLGENYERALARLASPAVPKIAHDTKPLMRRLLERGVACGNFVFDTAVAAYLLDATRGKYDLPRMTEDYLHFAPATEKEFPQDTILAIEASCVEGLHGIFAQKLREQGSDFGQMLSERIEACQNLIFDCAGGEFNINSTQQLSELLFGKLGLPPVKKTKSGYSTNVEVLEKLRDKHPVVQAIMDYRMLTKLKSTYADGLQKEVAADGRIHTTFQNTVTATGRLSSTEPNLQNIPVRTELGSEIRRMFVPRPGWVLVDADYSQIELRVLAHIAHDRQMQDAFRSGEDFHTVTASQVFGVPVSEVTPLMRRHAKAVNFGIVYGISEFSLAQDIGVSRREAKEYIDSYLARFSGVRAYMHDIVETARNQGYVETIFHRRRYIPEIKSSNFNVRSGAERIALNTPVQGSAADIIKLAMVRVRDALAQEELQAQLVLQVHDELIVECPAFEAPRVMEIVTAQMEHAVELDVPLVAEAKMGESWYAAK